jgi:protein O-GlcNAc transferase
MSDIKRTPPDRFAHAIELYRAGKLREAEALCRAIVNTVEHFDTRYLLANIQFRLGRPREALASYEAALALRPEHPEALYNRAIALQGLRRFEEALASYDQALAVKSDFAAAWINRGIALRDLKRPNEALASYQVALTMAPETAALRYNRGNALRDLQRFEEALESYDAALALKPDDAQAHNNRALTLWNLRRYQEALASYDRALAIEPNNPEFWYARGNTLRDLKRFEAALASYDAALVFEPDHADAHNNRGVALSNLRRNAEALESYDQALTVKPNDPVTHNNRGNALQEQRRYIEALASYDAALAIQPDYPEAHNNRGLVLWKLKRFAEALASYNTALALKPDYVEAVINRGPALWDLGRREEALAGYDVALSIRPDHAELLYNRGLMRQDSGRHDAAIGDFEGALRGNPNYKYLTGLLLHTKMQCCDWRGWADSVQRLERQVRDGVCASNPFALLGLSASARDQLLCAKTWVRNKCPASPTPLWRGEPSAKDKIHVAYLSADFRDHPLAVLMAGVFERHDHARFETTALSLCVDTPSDMRTRLKVAFDRFIDIRHDSDEEAALRLRELKVDIAVDLTGFTRDARPGIFALRPAPVQVNYLGLNATMGADYIDYILADRYVIPEDSRSCYSEHVVYLPETFLANDSVRHIEPAKLNRAAAGLPETGFVFCAFNNSYKITPVIFDLWMRLLQTIDGSVLWLADGLNAAVASNLRREAEHRGIAADRLIFAPRVPYRQYLANYRLADLFLDTSPFNGCTTASDALWSGLPLVTTSGETFVSRMAGSLLHGVGLPELVTGSLADYEALARRLAQEPEFLAAVRAKLGRNKAMSAVFDAERFCRHLEAAYERMWQRQRRGEPPAGFAVEPLR